MVFAVHFNNGNDEMRYRDSFMNYDIRTLTITNVLRLQAERHGNKTFLENLPDGRRWTFSEIDSESNKVANGLLAAGIGTGTHVALLMENSPEQVLTYFAIGKLGGVAVPINAAARGDQLAYFLRQSDSRAAVVHGALLDRVTEILPELPELECIVVLGDGGSSGSRAKCIAFENLYRASDSAPRTEVSFKDMAFIMYTSGTTGPSKGCIFNQARSLLWGLSHCEAHGYRHTDTFYVCMPLFHVSALQGTLYAAMALGAKVVLQRRFSATRFWSDIRESQATIANMMGSMANILWSQPPSPDDTRHKLRLCHVSPPPPFALEFEERFQMRFVFGYGLTDYCSSHALTLTDPVWKVGSAGRVRTGIEARIVDENDFEVPRGEAGELILRNNNPWQAGEGYYNSPVESLEAMRNGWFHTGDHAKIDEDGYLWFVGRRKDVIRRRGENISAFEIEKIVMKMPGISECAAFPLPSGLGEDDVALAIVAMPESTIANEELIKFCADKMAYYMVPRYILTLDELPKTLSHKVEKFRLPAIAQQSKDVLWDREAAGLVIGR